MARKTELDSEYARSAARGAIPSLLGDASEQVLMALLENPHLDETHLCLLLERFTRVRGAGAAIAGAAVAVGLTPFVPPGLPLVVVLLASLASRRG